MMTTLLLRLVLAQTSIGSGLADGTRLVYESAGVRQDAWVYDSVRVIERPTFDRCVRVFRPAGTRESCARGDTLFEPGAGGELVPVRPLGRGMQLAVTVASGNVLHYSTGDASPRRIGDDVEHTVIRTTIVTRDPNGTVVRRLREDYSPALLTAVWGVFEEPDGAGGWTIVREFSLVAVEAAR